jgi:WD40 repeat protein
VILWDVSERGEPTVLGPPLNGHAGEVSSVVFSPNGRTLAAVSVDQKVIMWDLVGFNDLRDHAVRAACGRTGRGLNQSEWAQYIYGLQYWDTCRK